MADTSAAIYSVNAGEVSRYGLARVDLAKLRMAMEQQSNWLPMVLGPCQMRPGTQFLDHSKSDLAGKFIEFYFSADATALLCLTPGVMRVMVNDAYIVRPAVTAVITNGGFDTDLASWTNSDEAGATSAWSAGGFMALLGTGATYAFRDQQVTVIETGVEHALRVVVAHGTVRLQVGTAQGDASYMDVMLAEGTYSLAFVPTGNFWIRLGAKETWNSTVDSIAIEASGIVELPTPWGANDFQDIFYDRSENVVFVASPYQQRRIERRGTTGSADSRSWGIARYYADDGPFRLQNDDESITLAPSGTVGTVNLTASRPLFKTGHVRGLWRLTTQGQSGTASLSAQNTFTSAIRVSGLTAQREFAINVSGVFNATVTLQRSLAAPGAWTTVELYGAPISKTFNDNLDNQVIFYRLGIRTGDYTSGTAAVTISYSVSIQLGIGRVLSVTNSTTAVIDVLQEFGSTGATSQWEEGEWSDYRGWPAAVAFHGGRLYWDAGIAIDGSVSDAFASFDSTTVGDAAPIDRTVEGGDSLRWMLSLTRLIGGTFARLISIRASALDEAITPKAYVARTCSTEGAAKLRALQIDQAGIFVARNGKRVYLLQWQAGNTDYASEELTRLKQEMCAAGIVDLAVQRHPDTRIWFVLGDGTCAVLTYELGDQVAAWTPFVTADPIERVAVLPGTDEDNVYFMVKRSISASNVRYIEKLAKRSECVGSTLSKNVDCHIVVSQAPSTTITGLSHLEGRAVVVWADQTPLLTAATALTVFGGQIVGLPAPATQAIVGLGYSAKLKSAKLAYGAARAVAIEAQKRVDHVGLIMADVGWKGVRVGRDFNHMTGLPATYKGRVLAAPEVLTAWDAVPGGFNGGWDSDARVCIEVDAPYPCTLMGVVLGLSTNDGSSPQRAPPAGESPPGPGLPPALLRAS